MQYKKTIKEIRSVTLKQKKGIRGNRIRCKSNNISKNIKCEQIKQSNQKAEIAEVLKKTGSNQRD